MRRRLWIPEVIQTSSLDCGPATLKALLEGFGIEADYGRLRDACQTDVDGTSIDALECVAKDLGLEVQQVVVPFEHLVIPEGRNLPAIAMTRLPGGQAHFVVLWRCLGPWVQIMDPSTGRRWVSRRRLQAELLFARTRVDPEDWWRWAKSRDFTAPLRARLRALGATASESYARISTASQAPSWEPLAQLDAAVRCVESLRACGAFRGRADRIKAVDSLLSHDEEDGLSVIPTRDYSVLPMREPGAVAELELRGAALVRVRGLRGPSEHAQPTEPTLRTRAVGQAKRPGKMLLRWSANSDRVEWALLALMVLAAIAGNFVEVLLLRSLVDMDRWLGTPDQRLVAVVLMIVFGVGMLSLEAGLALCARRLGRGLELRLRCKVLERLPRLPDHYFRSRLSSDLAERCHMVHLLRDLPALVTVTVKSAGTVAVTAAGIVWLAPQCAVPAITLAAVSLALPFAAQPPVNERDLRVRTHGGALMRFYLDAMVGIASVRAHAAEAPVRREHESLLAEWVRSSLRLLRVAVAVDGSLALIGAGFVSWLVVTGATEAQRPGVVLLVAYWGLNLPVAGRAFARGLRQYAPLHSVAARFMEIVSAPLQTADPNPDRLAGTTGVSIEFDSVDVSAGGVRILEGVSLSIASGEHVAIVGPSGAGKSTLVGALLGWHTPSSGTIRVDGETFHEAHFEALRARTAWLDPAVQLWNRTLSDNLQYSAEARGPEQLGVSVAEANLVDVLHRLPDGLQTTIGEGGRLLSGGEGQRVRLGRAAMHEGARLVLLDEPFRGLDAQTRTSLLARARHRWTGTTMLCVTHNLEDAKQFDRVVVVEGGRIVEHGDPRTLAARPDSVFARICDEYQDRRSRIWGSRWRRVHLLDGRARTAR